MVCLLASAMSCSPPFTQSPHSLPRLLQYSPKSLPVPSSTCRWSPHMLCGRQRDLSKRHSFHFEILIKVFSDPLLLPPGQSPAPLTCHQLPLGVLAPLHPSGLTLYRFPCTSSDEFLKGPYSHSHLCFCLFLSLCLGAPRLSFSDPCSCICSFTQQTFTDHLLRARHCARFWGYCAANTPTSVVLRA